MLRTRAKKWITIGAAVLFWTVSLFAASVSCACFPALDTGGSGNSCCCSQQAGCATSKVQADETQDCLRCAAGSLPFEKTYRAASMETTPVMRLAAPVPCDDAVRIDIEARLQISGRQQQITGRFLPSENDLIVILRI